MTHRSNERKKEQRKTKRKRTNEQVHSASLVGDKACTWFATNISDHQTLSMLQCEWLKAICLSDCEWMKYPQFSKACDSLFVVYTHTQTHAIATISSLVPLYSLCVAHCVRLFVGVEEFVLSRQSRAIQKFIVLNAGFSDFRRNCNFVCWSFTWRFPFVSIEILFRFIPPASQLCPLLSSVRFSLCSLFFSLSFIPRNFYSIFSSASSSAC